MTYDPTAVAAAVRSLKKMSPDDREVHYQIINDMVLRAQLAQIADVFILETMAEYPTIPDIDQLAALASYSVMFALGLSAGRYLERQSYKSLTEMLGEGA